MNIQQIIGILLFVVGITGVIYYITKNKGRVKMTREQKEEIMGIVDNEGFDYAFFSYSNFPEIKDAEFHKARVEYQKASKKLKEIVGFYSY